MNSKFSQKCFLEPLEQYQHQLYDQLLNKLHVSLRSQLEYKIWAQLQKELRDELWQENPIYALKEELEHQCQCL